MSLSKQLLELRKSAGLTQQVLADLLSINRSFISQVERYNTDLTASLLEKWIFACGYRLVIQREGDELAGLADDERALILALRQMREDRREIAMRFGLCAGTMDVVALAVLEPAIRSACGSSDSKASEGALEERRVDAERSRHRENAR